MEGPSVKLRDGQDGRKLPLVGWWDGAMEKIKERDTLMEIKGFNGRGDEEEKSGKGGEVAIEKYR